MPLWPPGPPWAGPHPIATKANIGATALKPAEKRLRAKSSNIITRRIQGRKRRKPTRPEPSSKPKRPSVDIHINAATERMIVRWPATCEGLLDDLREGECGIEGRPSYLHDGTYKKVSPLDVQAATKLLDIILPYKKMGILRIAADADFKAWYQHQFQAEQSRERAQSIIDVADPSKVQTIFDEFDIPLYWWQTVGFQFLNETTQDGLGALLTDRVGLGKTYTAIAHIVTGGHKALIVVPSGLRENWVTKPKHLAPGLTTYVVDGGSCLEAHKADIVVVSYKMLERWHVFMRLMELVEKQQRVLLLDEAHYIKNIDSGRTQNCLHLADVAKHTVPITATPLINRAGELYPLLQATRRSWTSMSIKQFRKSYESERGEKELAERLKGIMIRRHGEDVRKDMPSSEIGEIDINLTNKSDYEAAEKDFIQWLIAKGAGYDELASAERGYALKKINALRQLAVAGKVEPAKDIIQCALDGGERVAIFGSFNAPLREITRHFANKRGKDVHGNRWKGAGLINGTVSMNKRNRLIEEFNDGNLGLMCCNIKCSVGWDLPSACLGYFIDLPWTPADFEQSMGRLARLGQERDCQFLKLLAPNSIDQRMDEIMFSKAHSFMRAIDDPRAVDRITATDARNMGQNAMLGRLVNSYLMDSIRKAV